MHEYPHDKETALRKRVLGVLAGLLATVGSAFGVAASPAAADTVDPWSQCGSDYVVKYKIEIKERQPVGDPDNISAVGTLWVMRNRSSDTHCVLTTKKYRTERWTAAGIGYVSESGYRVLDADNYVDFAGPAYLERNDRTLKAYGRVGDGKVWVRCTTSCWLHDFAYS
ncbi:hypothetical protein SAMN04488074_107331 [Lentzea albidocapillata subsp. violacea]|uniref:Uncharacterized protein n=1 Tax=Lentzea albidocapillata subsp. violacea TaxID=128104 RepID=A0A1G9FE71_9PSEU|nr:hypothetical protein SAMN04488074_107331 [Lentzea albidocapillata subsp. violacea]